MSSSPPKGSPRNEPSATADESKKQTFEQYTLAESVIDGRASIDHSASAEAKATQSNTNDGTNVVSVKASPRNESTAEGKITNEEDKRQSPQPEQKSDGEATENSAVDEKAPTTTTSNPPRPSPHPLSVVEIESEPTSTKQQPAGTEQEKFTNASSPHPKAQQQPTATAIEVINAINPYSFYPNMSFGKHSTVGPTSAIPRKHYETTSVEHLMTEILLRQDQKVAELNVRRQEENASRRSVLGQALRTLQVRETAVETTEMSAHKLLLFDEKIQRKEKEVEQREIQVAAKDLENQKTERELRAREREQQIQYDKKVEPLAAREFQIGRKEDDLRTIESALEARVNAHSTRISAEEDAMRSRERVLRDNEIRLTEQLEGTAKAQAEYQNLHQMWQRKYKQLMIDEEQLNSREKELTAREHQLFTGEKALLATKQKLAAQESDLHTQKAELHAANAELEIQRTQLRQRQLKHDSAVNRLIDARSEVTHHEQSLEKKVDYSNKIFGEASEVYANANSTLKQAEEERSSVVTLKAQTEEKLRAVQARERQVKKFQQGLERQRMVLDATRTDLDLREGQLLTEVEDLRRQVTALQNNSSSAVAGLHKNAFLSGTLSGFIRIGTTMTSTSAANRPNTTHLALEMASGSPSATAFNGSNAINMAHKQREVAEIYGQPMSRNLVAMYAHRRELPFGAATATSKSSSSRQQLSATAPIAGTSRRSPSPQSRSVKGVSAAGARSGLLLPPIAHAKNAHRKSPQPSDVQSNSTSSAVVPTKNGPLTYDNPFALAANSPTTTIAVSPNRSTAPAATRRAGTPPSSVVAVDKKLAEEALAIAVEKEKNPSAHHPPSSVGQSRSPQRDRSQTRSPSVSTRASSSSASTRSTMSPYHSSDSSYTKDEKKGQKERRLRRTKRADKKKDGGKKETKAAASAASAMITSSSALVSAPPPPPPTGDGVLVDLLKHISQFWAEEQRCNGLELSLKAHLSAMKCGSVLAAKTAGQQSTSDDVSWTVEGGKSSTPQLKKKDAVPRNSGGKKATSQLNPSAYRLLTQDTIYECVYVDGAQRDAKTEFNYLVHSVLITAATATPNMPLGDNEDDQRPSEGDGAMVVYQIAAALYNASQAAGEPLSVIVTQSYNRARTLLTQRAEWLEGALAKIEISLTAAAVDDDDDGDNDKAESLSQQKATHAPVSADNGGDEDAYSHDSDAS